MQVVGPKILNRVPVLLVGYPGTRHSLTTKLVLENKFDSNLVVQRQDLRLSGREFQMSGAAEEKHL